MTNLSKLISSLSLESSKIYNDRRMWKLVALVIEGGGGANGDLYSREIFSLYNGKAWASIEDG